ncbi:filamentous hemagglutinin N-terminal domain-containing protein [Iningainema tapete]|uniref:Filamentous hemagglutinin N-terminal domain-containing protein n=1 Tax=Iningainema tapete BLCC-T55 TaxID=2748662 RepID=A0A8J6XPU3_9CYAN|nr:filamentous hemagglutinin N-terminal domain-containing protein [Iningainema tapete]MBD2775960.1 filamentous hemagglutinin N-terminal domain-containing protein [Iningainema tapete BLCC-T55]
MLKVSYNQPISCLKFAWVCLVVGAIANQNGAKAQIIPDKTLPVNSISTPGCQNCTIEGGTQVGKNLFHSFEQFSIPTNGRAYFNNNTDVVNIISRVTGLSASIIDGLIQANGKANVFLINPHGIIFSQGAALNIGGSFLGTTASA